MPKMEIKCQNCGKSFMGYQYEVDRRLYCSQSCSSTMLREPKTHGNCMSCGKDFISLNKGKKFCSRPCSQRYYRQQSKNEDNSLNTIKKSTKHNPCEICGWNEASCDVHHILEKSKGGTDHKNNLIVLCPNHHRMVHRNLVSTVQLKQLVELRTSKSGPAVAFA